MTAFNISKPHISIDSKSIRPTFLLPNSWFAANLCLRHEAIDVAAIKVITDILPHTAGPTETEMLPHCWVYSSEPSCSAWSSSVEEHTVRQAAGAAAWHYWAPRACRPPHRIYVRPKAVSPRCFYLHISMNARAHTQTPNFSPCPLKTDKELLFFNSINFCRLIYSTEHLHILHIHPEMKPCFITLRTWT